MILFIKDMSAVPRDDTEKHAAHGIAGRPNPRVVCACVRACAAFFGVTKSHDS